MSPWTGYPPLPTFRRQLASHACAWIPVTLRPSANIITRCPLWRKSLTSLTHSCYFTKLDTHHGYWSIILDQESSLLTTFNSPFGRYSFLQLPFGLICSQDMFQKKMDQILEECQGCTGITDDITVHGCTEAEHDTHL